MLNFKKFANRGVAAVDVGFGNFDSMSVRETAAMSSAGGKLK